MFYSIEKSTINELKHIIINIYENIKWMDSAKSRKVSYNKKNKWGNHQSKISKNQSNAIWWFFCVECTKNRPSSMLETHHKTDTTMCHFCAFMLFSVSTEILSVVNFLVEQGKRKKTKPSQWGKNHKNKSCHLLLPLLSEVTTQSDIPTLTQHVTQFLT